MTFEVSSGDKLIRSVHYDHFNVDMNSFMSRLHRVDIKSVGLEEVIGTYVDKDENVCHMRAYGNCKRLMVAGMRYKSVFPEEIREPPFDDARVVAFLCERLYSILYYSSHFVFPIKLMYGKHIIRLSDLSADLGVDLCPPRNSAKRQLPPDEEDNKPHLWSCPHYSSSSSKMHKVATSDDQKVKAADTLLQLPFLLGASSEPPLFE